MYRNTTADIIHNPPHCSGARCDCFGLYLESGFRAEYSRWLDALNPTFLSIPAGALTPILYLIIWSSDKQEVCQKIRFATSAEYFVSSSRWICKINRHHLQRFWAIPLQEEPLSCSCATQKLNAPICVVAERGAAHQSPSVSFWKSHQKVTMCLCKIFFLLSLFSFSHNWFVPHNELFILWKWFSGQASWSDMVIAASTGANSALQDPI